MICALRGVEAKAVVSGGSTVMVGGELWPSLLTNMRLPCVSQDKGIPHPYSRILLIHEYFRKEQNSGIRMLICLQNKMSGPAVPGIQEPVPIGSWRVFGRTLYSFPSPS